MKVGECPKCGTRFRTDRNYHPENMTCSICDEPLRLDLSPGEQIQWDLGTPVVTMLAGIDAALKAMPESAGQTRVILERERHRLVQGQAGNGSVSSDE